MNQTQKFLGAEADWPLAGAELFDVQPLWGGRRIRVRAGRAVVQLVERGQFERRYEFDLSAEAERGLLQAFVDHDFLTLQPPERPGRPDEARPALTLTSAAGEKHTVAKWAGVQDARFAALYAEFLKLAALAQDLQPVRAGRFEWGEA